MSERRPSARDDRSNLPSAAAASARTHLSAPPLRRYAAQHIQVMLYALGRLSRRPLGSALTIAVIGITLSLPAGLHVLLGNVTALSYSWQSTVQASLFLQSGVSQADGRALAKRLAREPEIASTRYISRDQALAEFRKLSGFNNALDALGSNPLPAVIAVQPRSGISAGQARTLVKRLGRRREVTRAKMDQAWVKRLYAVIRLISRGANFIAFLLAVAVIIVIGNTIRLDIQNQKEAIEVMKLLGASDRFIRRPFLYTGIWYGLLGALVAWIVVDAGLFALTGPISTLAGLYHSQFNLAGLSALGILVLIAAGTALGFLGSWWAVGRHLRAIQPR